MKIEEATLTPNFCQTEEAGTLLIFWKYGIACSL
jgi:hypothetical protein